MSRGESAGRAAAPGTEPGPAAASGPEAVLGETSAARPLGCGGGVPCADHEAVTATTPPPAASGPPAYTVRVSPRARRASLRMSVDRGLEVVVPRGFRLDRIPALVADKAAWIERVARRFAAENADAGNADAGAMGPAGPRARPRLPDLIELAALGEVWTVEYRPTASDQVRVTERMQPAAPVWPAAAASGGAGEHAGAHCPDAQGLLLVSGAVDDAEACGKALRRWLSRRAARHLPVLLAEVGREESLSYSKVAVRGQRTRWGSCSTRGVISLNRHLLFVPPRLVRYVILHELCHTVRADHSARFWREVRRREPEVDLLRKELRAAGRRVPAWARGLRPG